MRLSRKLCFYSILFLLLEIFVLALLLYRTNGSFVGREQCFTTVRDAIKNDTLTTINPTYFSPNFNRASEPFNPKLTVEGCQAVCGKGYGFYPDVAPRLLGWLVPIILIVTSMPLPPIGTRRYFTIIHLFGNPIDSTWSLLCELELWNNYAAVAESICGNRSLDERKKKAKYITPVLVAMDHLKLISFTTFKPGNSPQVCPCHSSELESLFFRTAGKLSDCRTHDTRRTCFAIGVYVVGVVANFVKTMGGSPSPSGGKIAPAMLLSWLLLTTLISNLIGQFNSPENVIRIIEDFRKELRQTMGMQMHESQHALQGKVEGSEPVTEVQITTTELDRKICPHMEVESQRVLWENLAIGKKDWARDPNWIEYLDAPAHGIPTYRPNKQLGNNMGLFAISTIPVILSFISAFTVLWSHPTYLTCRHFIVVAAFVAWLLSPFLNKVFFLSRRLRRNDEQGWHLVLLKDFSIAGPIIAILIASTSGLFSSCWCLSGVFILRRKAEVQLNPVGYFNQANGKIYPGIVAANFLLQLVVLGWIVMGVGRKKILMMRMSERETREALVAEVSIRKADTPAR